MQKVFFIFPFFFFSFHNPVSSLIPSSRIYFFFVFGITTRMVITIFIVGILKRVGKNGIREIG
jgi:hypothetical protein